MVTEKENKDIFLLACARGLVEDVRNRLAALVIHDDGSVACPSNS